MTPPPTLARHGRCADARRFPGTADCRELRHTLDWVMTRAANSGGPGVPTGPLGTPLRTP
jgi:hypothetical protein